jgi:hypothetical protein
VGYHVDADVHLDVLENFRESVHGYDLHLSESDYVRENAPRYLLYYNRNLYTCFISLILLLLFIYE